MLYHKEVFWPEGYLDEYHDKKVNLRFSKHSLLACLNDRYGTIIPPAWIIFDKNSVFEMEVEDGEVLKLAIRINTGPHDLSLVLMPEIHNFFVKTLWRNEINDKHLTLNKEKYCKKLNK